MNLIERLVWTVTGETAQIIIEDYEDTTDAAGIPVLLTVVTLLFGAGTAALTQWIRPLLAAAPFLIVGSVLTAGFALMTVLHLLASIQYAREWTSGPRASEVEL